MEKEYSKIILAVETTGKTMGVALLKGQVLLGELLLDAGNRHSDNLAESCRFILKSCGLEKSDLTHLAVCTGPGSFTGLRVGISFARTLAQFLNIPLIGIPIFELLAKQTIIPAGTPIKKICVTVPSIGEDLYAGFFRPGRTSPLSSYRVISKFKLARQLEREPKGKILLIEYGTAVPRAGILAILALEWLTKRTPPKDSWKKVLPLYLRPPIAQERKKNRIK